MTVYEESDEYCPHCDNRYVGYANLAFHYNIFDAEAFYQVIDAKTPQAAIGVESEDVRMESRCVSLNLNTSFLVTNAVVACSRTNASRVIYQEHFIIKMSVTGWVDFVAFDEALFCSLSYVVFALSNRAIVAFTQTCVLLFVSHNHSP